MSNPPSSVPDLTDVPGSRWLASLSMVALAVILTHLLTAPGMLVTITGFITVFMLPIILIYGTIRAAVLSPRALGWVRRQDVISRIMVPDPITADEAE